MNDKVLRVGKYTVGEKVVFRNHIYTVRKTKGAVATLYHNSDCLECQTRYTPIKGGAL